MSVPYPSSCRTVNRFRALGRLIALPMLIVIRRVVFVNSRCGCIASGCNSHARRVQLFICEAPVCRECNPYHQAGPKGLRVVLYIALTSQPTMSTYWLILGFRLASSSTIKGSRRLANARSSDKINTPLKARVALSIVYLT